MQHEKFILKPGDLPPHQPVCEHVIVGRSKAARELRQMIELAAMANYPVLLTGPVGSGKDSAARALQSASRLHDRGFTVLNCAQMSNEDLSAALSDPNLTGVRYIDGIESLAPDLQLQLIKRIDQDTISGHRKSRTIASTHTCLTSMVSDGSFDKNLYYRLSLLTIPVPALRHRRDDIPVLVNHFLMQLDHDKRFKPDKAALDLLMQQPWRGNIKELRNVVARGALFHPGRPVGFERMSALTNMGHPNRRTGRRSISKAAPTEDLPESFDLKAHLDQEEARFLRHALDRCDGVVKQAADLSGLRRTTFVEKMRRHGISRTSRE